MQTTVAGLAPQGASVGNPLSALHDTSAADLKPKRYDELNTTQQGWVRLMNAQLQREVRRHVGARRGDMIVQIVNQINVETTPEGEVIDTEWVGPLLLHTYIGYRTVVAMHRRSIEKPEEISDHPLMMRNIRLFTTLLGFAAMRGRKSLADLIEKRCSDQGVPSLYGEARSWYWELRSACRAANKAPCLDDRVEQVRVAVDLARLQESCGRDVAMETLTSSVGKSKSRRSHAMENLAKALSIILNGERAGKLVPGLPVLPSFLSDHTEGGAS